MHSIQLKALSLLLLAPLLSAQSFDPAQLSAAASQIGAALPSSVDIPSALASLSSLTQDPAVRASASALLASNSGLLASNSAALHSALGSAGVPTALSGVAGAATSAVAAATSKAGAAGSMATRASQSASKVSESATKAAGGATSSKSTGGVGAQPTAAIVGAGAAMAGILGVAAML